jgi:hypothetical protein
MSETFYKEVLGSLTSNTDYIKSMKINRFKNQWLIDVVFNTTILNIVVGNNIIVNQNNTTKQHVLDFYKNEKVFHSIKEFDNFIHSIIQRYKEKTEGVHATYRGKDYTCDIEVISVDVDRGMGQETIYGISLTDDNGEEIAVAEVSEYPTGSFSIINVNSEIEFDEGNALNYFHKQMDDNFESEE